MTAHKHPIAHHWIKHTLVPFLLYAFASTLPYPADISEQIQRSIDFCLAKPDYSSDGDDLVFERVFMAIMHRHRNLAPDLVMVVENLEPLAKYLIRRAQLKGPYELLGRSDVGSGAWVEYEWDRLSNIFVEPEEAEYEPRLLVRPPSVATKPPPTEDDIDPRLVHAQPSHFATANLPGQLTAQENSYYWQQNHDFEQAQLRRQQQSIYTPTAPALINVTPYTLPGRGPSIMTIIHESPYHHQQQQEAQQLPAPISVPTPRQAQHQTSLLTQTDPTTQAQRRVQISQPESMLLGTSQASAPSWPYVPEQRALPRLQPAQLPSVQSEPQQRMLKSQLYSAQPGRPQGSKPIQPQAAVQHQSPRLPQFHHPPSQYQPRQYQANQYPGSQQHHAQSMQPGRQYPHFPPLFPQTPLPRTVSMLSQPTPPPTLAPNTIPSSDFSHLRGSDQSNAAQQRVREIAAKITAQERDNMAQGILQRQQSIAQQPSGLTSAASMCSPTKQVPGMLPRSHSTIEFSNDPVCTNALAHTNASAYANAPANLPPETFGRQDASRRMAMSAGSGWGMAMSDNGTHGGRAGLPMLEQVHSRYHPVQQQNYPQAPTPSTVSTQVYSSFMSQAPTAQAAASAQMQARPNMLLQQPAWNTEQTDALQQLKYAAGLRNGASTQSTPDGEMTEFESQQTSTAG